MSRKRSPRRFGRARRLSVVMPVHNAVPYLDEAVGSILAQSHTDFEFVIGDDASTDGSAEKLRGWAGRDRRIRLVRREDNLGPVGSSNWVVANARGSLIARMDADDVSHPDRLRRQIRLLGERPDAVLTGSPPVGIDRRGRRVREQNRWIAGRSGFNAPFAHGSVMYRRGAFDLIGGYRRGCDLLGGYRPLSAHGGTGPRARPVRPALLLPFRRNQREADLRADSGRSGAAPHEPLPRMPRSWRGLRAVDRGRTDRSSAREAGSATCSCRSARAGSGRGGRPGCCGACFERRLSRRAVRRRYRG